MGLTIRPGRPSDASDVAVAHVAAWQVAYRGLVPDDFLDSPMFLTARQKSWHRLLTGDLPNGWDPDHEVFVPDIDGRVVGFAHVGRERIDDQTDPNGVVLGAQGELYGFYIHPDHWGSGFANALLDASMSGWTIDFQQLVCGFYVTVPGHVAFTSGKAGPPMTPRMCSSGRARPSPGSHRWRNRSPSSDTCADNSDFAFALRAFSNRWTVEGRRRLVVTTSLASTKAIPQFCVAPSG